LSAFDCTLGRAATVVIGLLLAHSFVDYPMRTEAIMAVFAVSCALLMEPLRPAESAVRSAIRSAARRKPASNLPPQSFPTQSVPAVLSAVPVPETVAWRAPQAGGRWGEEIEWPDEWRDSGSDLNRPESTGSDPEHEGSSEPGDDDADSGPTA
jgi:hypothetical protein